MYHLSSVHDHIVRNQSVKIRRMCRTSKYFSNTYDKNVHKTEPELDAKKTSNSTEDNMQVDTVFTKTSTTDVTTKPHSKHQYKQTKRDKYGKIKRYVSVRQTKLILTRQKCKCNLCKTDLDMGLEMDHIIEIADGGTNDDENYNLKTSQSQRTRELNKIKDKKDQLDKIKFAEDHYLSPYFL
jgi:hypothetical protein